MSKKIATRVVATSNRSESLLGSEGGGASQTCDKVWRWGSDNMLPYALSLLARRSVAHRRILNDKADYVAGKGLVYDDNPLLHHIATSANGSGESLRSVIARLALDEAMFGNAFLEVVTNEQKSLLSFYHIDASKCRIANDSKHVVIHHDWRNFSAKDAVISRMIPMVRPSSSLISATGSFFCNVATQSSHRWINTRNSLSSSATRLSSATVRTITPNPLGLIDCTSCLSRPFSACRLILLLTITLSIKGMSTKLRPVMDISAESLGPLELIGSFVTCTKMVSPTFR